MSSTVILGVVAGLALIFSIMTFGWRLRNYNKLTRPVDHSTPKGSINSGVLYAYTLGMAPWSKESTRLHWMSYIRGIAFHLGIFLCLALLIVSPWIYLLPSEVRILLGLCAGLGAIFGMAGFVMRLVEYNLKAISTKDDYFTVLLVSLYLASAGLWLVIPPAQPIFYLTGAVMLIYAPFSKIRHCIYFAYSRLFYGKFIGSRAVLPHSQQVVR